MGDTSSFDSALQRFVEAQNTCYEQVRAELRAARKRTHWMWFIFPQVAGLGTSAMSARYAIMSAEEGRHYVRHPVLGPRLRECTQLVLDAPSRMSEDIFGSIDSMKFHSSMTLFQVVAVNEQLFTDALEKYFGGRQDAKTLALLEKMKDH